MDHLLRRLSHFARLSKEDESRLKDIGRKSETFAAAADIVQRGTQPDSVFVVTRGFAYRYRILRGRDRQIMTFLLPGDIFDLHAFLLREMDHSIAALVETEVVVIPRDEIANLLFGHPRFATALGRTLLQEEAMLRERLVALGRRKALGRMAYLLCELFWRFRAVGETDGDSIHFPLTQEDIGDCLGLSAVHVNRTIQLLRKEGLVTTTRGKLHINDIARLSEIAEIDAHYLQLEGATDLTGTIIERTG